MMSGHLRIYAELRGYGARGPRYRVRLNKADGAVLVDSTTEPLLDAARVLISKGITGKLQLWDATRPYYRLQGDIAWLATRTVTEGREQSPALRRYVERAQDGQELPEPSSSTGAKNGRPCLAAQGSGGIAIADIEHQCHGVGISTPCFKPSPEGAQLAPPATVEAA